MEAKMRRRRRKKRRTVMGKRSKGQFSSLNKSKKTQNMLLKVVLRKSREPETQLTLLMMMENVPDCLD